ncbi:MAG: NAD-dependent epimerase/dehydratase family protein [Ignavibacteriae bacterium]|nr:MAG: NAD-dependent epimerase/dehydratase family protein [Ignavibacteriota bacterium]
MKRILILGGTGFVGRILSEKLAQTDNRVTLFNRGKRNPGILPEHERIQGDRETGDIKKITSNDWDVVIDFSGMQPGNIDKIVNMLKGRANRYIFISTASAYPLEGNIKTPIPEEQETLPCSQEQYESPDIGPNYGQKKAECERILLAAGWLDTIIFRPGLIFGRYDPTDRFYYWLHRVKTQNEILIPEEGKSKGTNTFSEDFANVIYSAIDIPSHNKVYNAVTHDPVSIREYLDIAVRLLNTNPKFINAPLEFLRENEITEWLDLPLWISEMDLVMENKKMLNDFPVKMRSFEESVAMCIDYYSSLKWYEPKYGIKTDKEKELIDKLKS